MTSYSAEEFDEEWYLFQNKDVCEMVKVGVFRSGHDHYIIHGRQEGRLPTNPNRGTPNSETRNRPIRHLRDDKGLNGIAFREIIPHSCKPPISPQFIFGTFPADLASRYFRNTHLPALGIYALQNAQLSGEFLITLGGSHYSCFEANIHPSYVERQILTYADQPSKYKLSGKHVLLAGPGHHIYGHWLVDFLPKLWLLQQTGYDIDGLYYLVPADTPTFAENILDLVGIPPEQIIKFDGNSGAIELEELLIPPIFHNGVRFADQFRQACFFLQERIEKRFGPLNVEGSKDIFVSRSRSSQTRPLLNRDAIEQIALANGFHIVHPETMPILDQARLFASARRIIGEYGSALHSTIFNSSGCTVCTLRGTFAHPAFLQNGIGNALNHPTGVVFGVSHGTDTSYNFIISEEDFSAALGIMTLGDELE